jgi:hypothetical protein
MPETVQQANVCTNTTKWYIYSITLALGSNTVMDILQRNRATKWHKDRPLKLNTAVQKQGYWWSKSFAGLERPWVFQKVEAPRLQDNRHMKVVRLSDLGTGRLCPQEIFLVLISFRRLANIGATVRLEGIYQWKNPMKPSESNPRSSGL